MAESKKLPTVTRVSSEDKLKALKSAMENIEKVHGKGAIINMGAQPQEALEVIPTGSVGLDIALGVGVILVVVL